MTRERWWWALVGGVALVCVWIGSARLDPDFGWHLKMGEYILSRGIPVGDPFSFTMPSFEFVDHEWLTNVVMYSGHEVGGRTLMSVIGAGIVGLTMAVAVPRHLRRWAIIPGLLVAALLWPRAGVRPQVVDWLMFVVMLRWWESRESWVKYRWLLPAFFGMWANVHGGVAIGVAVLLFLMGVRGVVERKVDARDVGAWILGLIATVINPYGWGLWNEVIMQITDPYARWNISEWMPAFWWLEMGFGMMVVLTGMVMWRFRQKYTKEKIMLTLGLGIAAISSIRHVPFFALVAMPVIASGLMWFWETVQGEAISASRTKWFYNVLVGVFGIVALLEVGTTDWELGLGTWSRFYPQGAIEYVQKEKLNTTRIFSDYGWGGYLIWKLPTAKYFIDGRMATWKRSGAPEGESEWIFKEYLRIVDKGEWEELFDKYKVETVIWHSGERTNPILARVNLILKQWNIQIWQGKKDKKPLLTQLTEGGWEKVYEDATAVVLIRP